MSLKLWCGILVVFVLLAAPPLWLRHELSNPFYGAAGPETFVDIPKGSNTRAIADLLVNAGVLRYRIPFMIYLRWTGEGRHLQAGEYRFIAPATPPQIIERLVRGDIYYRSVTIPEGLTAAETTDLLVRNGIGDPLALESAIHRTDCIRDLEAKANTLEGYLFPDTYHFSRNVDSDQVIRTLTGRFHEEIRKILVRHPLPAGWTIGRIVTLASMVEKEAKSREERPLIASVLVNRLQKGMPLACDPTIIYALKQAGRYDGNIRKADLGIESPYNTYLHAGLPPGPIANPGADSLLAALAPAKTDYLYFVSRNDGTHQFSKDYRSHEIAVNRFQKRVGR